MKRMVAAMFILALALPLAPVWAQRSEFLTDGEILEIRDAQDPNHRLKLYAEFAQRRLDAIAKLMDGSEPGRGERIHGQLEEYDRIIDAIDKNVDQAAQRRDIMRKGLEHALKNEPQFLRLLESIRDRNPKDLDDYRFILDRAIESTEDSIEGLSEVLKKQPKGKEERVLRHKKETEAGDDHGRREGPGEVPEPRRTIDPPAPDPTRPQRPPHPEGKPQPSTPRP